MAVAAVGLTRLGGAVGGSRGRRRRLAVGLAVLVAATTAVRPAVALVRLGDRSDENRRGDLAFDQVDLEGRRVASLPASMQTVGSRCADAGCVYLGAPATGDVADPVVEQLVAGDVDVLVVLGGRDVDLGPRAVVVDRSTDPEIVVWDVSRLAPVD